MTCTIINHKTLKRINRRHILTPVGRAPPGHLALSKDRHLLFFFMCRFTCSRCWHTAVELGRLHEQFLARGTAVVLVGSEQHLRPALKLAVELGIPFPIFGDRDGAIRQYYLAGGSQLADHNGELILVDRCGKVRTRRDDTRKGAMVASQILAEVRGLSPS